MAFERIASGPQERYVAHGQGYTVVVTDTKAIVRVQSARTGAAADSKDAAISMELAGAQQARAIPGSELPGKVNYIRGNDPRRWQLGLPTYDRVTYREVYPGIDIVYYGNQQQLEFDLVLKPGADPGRVRMRFAGTQNISVDAAGDLVLVSPAGKLRIAIPAVYQVLNGVRTPVHASYKLRDGEVTFAVGMYDRSRTLVIDPAIAYATLLGGGTGGNFPQGIAVDSVGNTYIAGYTDASDFPVLNAFQASQHGSRDGFISKMNAAGSGLVFSTYLGGSSQDQLNAIALDKNTNSPWITGSTLSSDFPTMGAYQSSLMAIENAVVVKLNANGTLAYSTFLGATAFKTVGNSIAVDSSGNAYVAGSTFAGFVTTSGVVQPTANNGEKAFATKFSSSGAVTYSTFIGGDQTDLGMGIAADSSGNAYITGQSFDVGFTNAPSGGAQTTDRGNGDAFVVKLNPTGSAILYFTFLGGTGADQGNAITLDRATPPNAYIGGSTSSTDLTIAGGIAPNTYDGGGDAFLAKLNGTGSAFTFLTYIGGNRNDSILSLSLDSGGVYITGTTDSSNFPTASPFQATIPSNVTSLFVTSNGGTSWTPLDAKIPGAVTAISPDPTNTNVVVAATDNGIFRSTNGGSTWTLENATALNSLSRSPANSSVIYGGVSTSVYVSTDNGVTWNLGGFTGAVVNGVVADPLNQNTVYIFNASGGVLKSTSAGSTPSWNTANSGLASTGVLTMVSASDGSLYVSLSGQGIYKSTNQGGSWSAVNSGLPNGLSATAIAAAPSNASDLYLTNGTIYKTTNGGVSWSATGGNIPDNNAGVLAVSPTNPNTLYAASPDAPTVYVSTNAGLTWSAAGSGLGIATPTSIAIDPTSANHIYAVAPVHGAGFIAKVNTSGSAFIYSSYLTGTGGTTPSGVAADGSGNSFVTGNTMGGFVTTSSAFQTSQPPNIIDGFIVKISDTTPSCALPFPVSPSGNQNISGAVQTLTFDVTAPTGCTWTAASDSPWTTFPNGMGGTGTGSVSVQASQNNSGSTRTANLTIAGQTIQVIQANVACTYTLSNYNPGIPSIGGNLTINVTAGAGCNWSVLNNYPNVITAVMGSSGSGNGTVTLTIARNTSGTIRSMTVPIVNTSFTILQPFAVAGDFDGNGVPDLVWQFDSTNQAALWYMGGAQGTQFQSFVWVAQTGPTGWTIATVTDLNQDGVPDIIWQNTNGEVVVWYMGGQGGHTPLSWAFLQSSPLANWKVIGAADLNGDGTPDIVWQNTSTAQAAVWYMGGPQGNVFQSFQFMPSAPAGWNPVGLADFDGDGHPDLVWQNASTRQAVVWFLGGRLGNQFLNWAWLQPNTNTPTWKIVGLADLDSNGHPDLIWQEDNTRAVEVWFMNGTIPTSAAAMAGQTTGWTAQMVH